ncbi:HigA family addiction module antitoxin [Serratia marcescens]|uniref:HigA family addiction module antitoxin n=1 Tax=Serratia TaxID=613 RepID=UPI000744E8D8|nr:MULTISPECIES: HigA family addiction module antitoxin [Serratia]EHT9932906.1 HigA family addiction module antidote protein [Serratia marcescens]EIJ6675272.1 HigA family addiction module antidote protein [Serratia marcescens]MDR4884259.1 HigA family addiction module antitoxin [Serratia marcescens]QQU62415.1 HigA family addiction module antidote protein [Serratia ureilytica]RTF38325.1 addiction module antidote protein, HigA family [Serratia marcescens]
MVQAQRKPTSVGDVLLYEYLEPTGLKINDLAEMLNVHRNTVSALVNNNRKLTVDMAFRLAKAFDTTEQFWLNLQLNLDLWEIQNDARIQEELNRVITMENFLEKREHPVAA